MRAVISLFFYFSFSIPAFAKNYAHDFNKAWTNDYTPLACSDNVLRLYQRMDFPKNAHVIHIFHKHLPHINITPIKQRLTYKDKTYKSSRWLFHAVLLIDGIVYDLDYFDSPTPIEPKVYFNEMWPQTALYNDYRFQIKPVGKYNAYDTDGFMNGSDILDFDELSQLLNSI